MQTNYSKKEGVYMRIILKIIAAPFVVVLTIVCAMLTFLFCWAKVLTAIASGIIMLLAIILFFMGQITGGIVFAVIAFLCSPVGLPAIAEWLIDKLDDLKFSLKGFMTS